MREPILEPNDERFVIFPIIHQDIWDLYKAQQAAQWTVEELDLLFNSIDLSTPKDSSSKMFYRSSQHLMVLLMKI